MSGMTALAFMAAAQQVVGPPPPLTVEAVPEPFAAQMTVDGKPVQIDSIAAAELLIETGHFAEARALLDALAEDRPHDHQVQFLLGLLDMQDKSYDGAIGHFHRILVSEPKAVRVRLELGRAYFESGDYANAERQFRFARAGDNSSAVTVNIDRYLTAIRSLKRLSFTVSLAVVPDSNRNAGPATDSVTLYGLPFELSPDAKANSGIGLMGAAGAEWTPRLSKTLGWRTGAQIYRAQYIDTRFDDMTVGVYTGPHVTLRKWDINLTGSVSRRWYGDRTYSNSFGGGIDITRYLDTRMGLNLSANIAHIDYARNPLQDGTAKSLGLGFFYIPTPASIVRANAAIGETGARIPAYSYHYRQASLSYSREFVGGLTVSLAPSVTRIVYEGRLAAFPEARRDTQFSAQIGLIHRRIDLGGFTPRIAYTFTRNASNLPLYNFDRSRFEFGVTTAF